MASAFPMLNKRQFRIHWHRELPWAGLALAGTMLASSTVLAQALVNPVVVELGARQRAAAVSITLSEKAKAPMRLQAEVLEWRQDLQGQDITTPNSDLLIAPPIAELRPGQTQVFRVALRGPRPAPEELAYRLILEDIAEPSASASVGPGMAVSFRMRYDLPVMVAPVGKIINALHWKPCPSEEIVPAPATTVQGKPSIPGSQACVRILNAGNRRVKVKALTLIGNGWQQSLPLKESVNVLVGAEREWRIPLQANQAGALHSVHVHTEGGEKLQAKVGRF
jgi:fimbrial chaperone protein